MAAIVALVASAGLGATVGARQERGRWESRYESAVVEASHWEADSKEWERTSDRLESRLRDIRGEMQSLKEEIRSTVGDLDKPRFTLWNSCQRGQVGCPLTPGRYYVAGVPDTFTYYVKFRATVPVTVRIMSSDDFVCWNTGLCSWRSVGWEDRSRLNGVFHEAEGCGGYFAVFTSDRAGTLYPNVQIERNPAPGPTGTCR